jgi:hypothetical protein
MYKKIPKVESLRTKTRVAKMNRNSLIKETCTFSELLSPGKAKWNIVNEPDPHIFVLREVPGNHAERAALVFR